MEEKMKQLRFPVWILTGMIAMFVLASCAPLPRTSGKGKVRKTGGTDNEQKAGGMHKALTSEADGWDLVPLILARIVPPTFPDRDFMVTSYGAEGDDSTNNYAAFKNAITACAHAGGGRVVVPAGTYLINGPIHLKSNVNLHLAAGSYIKFGTNPADYLVGSPEFKGCVPVRWEGVWCYNYSPLIYAWGEENVAVTGSGTIDGQMDKYWYSWYVDGLHTDDRVVLRKQGMDLVPVEQKIFGAGHHLAPGTIEFYHCKNVLIEGITTRMPLERTIHPTYCENVTIRNVNVQSGVEAAQNDDGIDPDSCTDVLIEDCTIHNYDDGIALKAGRAKEGWPEHGGRACENVIIRRNILHGEHNGVSVGSDMSGGVRNVFIYDCQFGVDRKQGYVFAVKSNCDRGGVVDRIYARGITVDTCQSLVHMETDYKGVAYDPEEHPYPPLYRDMYFENIRCRRAESYGIYLSGLPQKPISGIHLKDITIDEAATAKSIENALELDYSNVRINGKDQD
jgi:polygalacturonase